MKEIKFEDIRKGDLIRIESTNSDLEIRRTGITKHKNSHPTRWATEDGVVILTIHSEGTVYLIDRPVPPLPTEPGTVFRVTAISGINHDSIALVATSFSGAPFYLLSTPLSGAHGFKPEEITAWEPIK